MTYPDNDFTYVRGENWTPQGYMQFSEGRVSNRCPFLKYDYECRAHMRRVSEDQYELCQYRTGCMVPVRGDLATKEE